MKNYYIRFYFAKDYFIDCICKDERDRDYTFNRLANATTKYFKNNTKVIALAKVLYFEKIER